MIVEFVKDKIVIFHQISSDYFHATIKQILLFLKNYEIKIETNTKNSKMQFVSSHSTTMSFALVNYSKQRSMKKKILYLLMIHEASKFKATNVAKIKL